MTQDEAMKMALEALESDNPYLRQLAANAIRNAFVQPVQEPVAWADKRSLDQIANFDATIYAKGGFDYATPLYTTPPLPVQRKPLTHIQAKELVAKYGNDLLKLVFQTEAAHGIKENT